MHTYAATNWFAKSCLVPETAMHSDNWCDYVGQDPHVQFGAEKWVINQHIKESNSLYKHFIKAELAKTNIKKSNSLYKDFVKTELVHMLVHAIIHKSKYSLIECNPFQFIWTSMLIVNNDHIYFTWLVARSAVTNSIVTVLIKHKSLYSKIKSSYWHKYNWWDH